MQDDLITLDPSEMIAEGGERMVFAHPDHQDRLIKVVKPRDGSEFNLWTFGHLTQRFIPSARWRSTVKQYDEYNRLMLGQLFDVNLDLPVSHLYGFIKTNLGLGCITERVTDDAGNNAPTLLQLVKEKTFTPEHLDSLNAFIERLYGVSVVVSDVSPANFVYGHRHIGPEGVRTDPEWVLIDGFGDRYAITVRSISRWVRSVGLDDCFKRKYVKKYKRTGKVRGLNWNRTARRFEFAFEHVATPRRDSIIPATNPLTP